MEYAITFADVMSLVITGAIGLIGWFLKGYLADIKKQNERQQKKLEDIDAKYSKRISELEEEERAEIKRLDREMSSLKGDFATTFVLREDYFRAMNKVEDSVRSIDQKIDRLLMQNSK